MKKQIILGGKVVSKSKAGWLLFLETWNFLLLNKNILKLTLVISVSSVVLLAGLFLSATYVLKDVTSELEFKLWFTFFLFCFYILGAFGAALLEGSIMLIVHKTIHGVENTPREMFRLVFAMWRRLLSWSVLFAVVLVVLNRVASKFGMFGVFTSLIGRMAWAAVTYFMVPVLVMENKKIRESVGSSAALFGRTWGETLVSNISAGVVFRFISIVFCAFVFIIARVTATYNFMFLTLGLLASIPLFFVGLALVSLSFSAILKALLYMYATENIIPQSFDRELLENILERQASTEQTSTVE